MKTLLLAFLITGSFVSNVSAATVMAQCYATKAGSDYMLKIVHIGGPTDTSMSEVKVEVCEAKIDNNEGDSCVNGDPEVGFTAKYISLNMEEVDFIHGKGVNENIMVELKTNQESGDTKAKLLNVQENFWDFFEEGPEYPKSFDC